MCSRPEAASPKKRKQPAHQRTVVDKRARSIRDPDPPLTVDTGIIGHDEDDDTGVSGHDEDDDTGVTRDQAAESNEQLRRFHRFRRNVHTLLRFLVERQTPDLLAVGPLDEIEDYIQRVLTSLLLPLE